MSKDSKSQIVIELLGEYTETYKHTNGIVAYSFFIRVSCLDFNTIILEYKVLGPVLVVYYTVVCCVQPGQVEFMLLAFFAIFAFLGGEIY